MKNLSDLSDFKALKITLASPEEILQWTHGEVTKPETINYRTFRPEKDGLFDERIFGPTKDYECYCGKYKRIRYKGVICDKCGVEVTHSRVRRERVGHIVLACPVVHVWYFRGIPSQLGILLEISPRDLESVVYFSSYLAVEVKAEKKAEVISEVSEGFEAAKKKILEEKEEKAKATFERSAKEREKLKKKGQENKRKEESSLAEITLKEKKELGFIETEFQKTLEEVDQEAKRIISRLKEIDLLSVIPEAEYFDLASYLNKFTTLKMGAEAVLTVLQQVDLEELSKNLKRKLLKATGQNRLRSAKRLRLVEGFRNSGVNPAWTVLKHLVVIPPELRPMVQLEGGRFATSDLNDLYRRVINRNNRLRKLLDLGAPEIIIRNEKRMLQEAVDSLIDSSKQRATVKPMRGKQELRSLSDMLKGKQGRFRKNLLGKRVDYSGRSVIVVGPNLRLDQCGLPKEMVLELFKPFVLGEILKKGLAPNLKSARFVLERRGAEIWDILENLTLNHPVLLNRAPTLHRLGIRAFYPILIDGSAIQVHPCVCTGFNADFDGDQMAVHVPLSQSSKKEAQELMLSTKNLLSPASGSMVTLPNRDMLVGCYYLTTIDEKNPKSGMIFGSRQEALLAHQFGKVKLRSLVKVLIDGKILETTVGRIIFNSVLPAGHSFFNAEINRENNALKVIIEETLAKGGEVPAVTLIDDVKRLGFHYATEAGYSMGLSDCIIPSEKPAIIKGADDKVAETDLNFRRGLITKREKLRLTESIWMEVTNRLDDLSRKSLSQDNPLRAMVVSGARGTWDQVKQICGTRGLIVDPLGRLVELPIKSNYMEGLSGFEYFASARGARKGLVDTALKTADAGYLTRRLVDVAQDVIVRTEDCDTHEGIEIIKGEEHLLTSFTDRLYGRVLAEDLPDPRSSRKVLLKRNSLILEKEITIIKEVGVLKVKVRSAVLCEARFGICSMCYGLDLARQEMVTVGIPVGIIAAQSIGEPGTQLTLRTKHVSGIVTSKDVTQGLPRIEELFEARVPKFLGILSETVGKIDSIIEKENSRQIHIKAEPESGLPDKVYEVDLSLTPLVKEGELVSIGTQICEGYLDLTESLRTRGYLETSKYIIVEIQKVYSSQGVSLNDKHVEVIVRQMFSRLRTENSGDSKFLPGEIISKSVFFEENNKILEKDKEPATAETVLLGITKSALQTESFLAAASFIETTRELTEASITGKVDRLLGLKENVIIGRLIPVGERARIE